MHFTKKHIAKSSMAIQAPFLLCLLALAALWASTQGEKPTHYSIPFNRTSFPPGFIFGAGSSAYQVARNPS